MHPTSVRSGTGVRLHHPAPPFVRPAPPFVRKSLRRIPFQFPPNIWHQLRCYSHIHFRNPMNPSPKVRIDISSILREHQQGVYDDQAKDLNDSSQSGYVISEFIEYTHPFRVRFRHWWKENIDRRQRGRGPRAST